jgi:hypothetical protein
MAAMLTLSLLGGCEEKFKPPPKEDKPAKKARTESAPPKEEPKTQPKEEEPPTPAEDPTTPEEIAKARNIAILDNRIDDALRLCGKEDLTKVDDQGVLGCVLTACRKKDSETASKWAGNLEGPLLKEARKVCASNGVGPL